MSLKIHDVGDSLDTFIEIDGERIDLTDVVEYQLKRVAGDITELKLIYQKTIIGEEIDIKLISDKCEIKEVNKGDD